MEKKYLTFEEIETIRCDMDEAETTIGWMRGDETIRIYTSDNTMVTKLKQKVKNNPAEYKIYEASRNKGFVTGYFIEMPLKYLSFRGGSDPEALAHIKSLSESRKA